MCSKNYLNLGKMNLYSEIKFKIKEKHVRQFANFCLRQQLFLFKGFCLETRLSNIWKTAKVMKLTKETILESSYKYLQVKFK